MRFLHGKLKVNKGGVITVNFSKPTRVLIMPDRQFKRYRDNITFTYYGGHKESPYEFKVPKTDVWHVVVEKGIDSKPLDLTASFTSTQAQTIKRTPPRSIATSLKEADEQMDHEAADASAAADEEEKD